MMRSCRTTTALEFHGRAYSVWRHLTYVALRPLAPLTFRHHVYQGTRFPEALVHASKEQFGVSTAERASTSLKVTSLERTLVDVLDRPHISGGWEEIWRSLETVEFFDLDRVVEYVLLLGKATTASKVGYYLEEHRESLMVEERHLRGTAQSTSTAAPLRQIGVRSGDRRPWWPHGTWSSRPRWSKRSWAEVT